MYIPGYHLARQACLARSGPRISDEVSKKWVKIKQFLQNQQKSLCVYEHITVNVKNTDFE